MIRRSVIILHFDINKVSVCIIGISYVSMDVYQIRQL